MGKPGQVRVVLQAWMTKQSLDDPTPNYTELGSKALTWWESEVLAPARKIAGIPIDFTPDDESFIADQLIAGLRRQEVWGAILRGDAS